MDVDIAEVVTPPADMNQELTGVLRWAIDPELAGRLWHMSEKMTGVGLNDE